MSDLYHHGIKGQRWGVRRFQNPDGTLTASGKERYRASRNIIRNRPYTNSVNTVVKSLSGSDKKLLGADLKKDWIDTQFEDETLSNVAKTVVSETDGKPTAFAQIWTNGSTKGQFAVASTPESRGTGNASKSVKEAIDWASRYGTKSISELEWTVYPENAASIHLAEKYGFELQKRKTEDGQLVYTRKNEPLSHSGIKGMHWGVRRYQNEDGSLTPLGYVHYGIKQAGEARRQRRIDRKDNRWVNRHGDKIYKKTYNAVKKQAKDYLNKDLAAKYGGRFYSSSGKLNNNLVSDYNKKLASLMNERVGDISAPSGKVIRYVAKRRELGVYTALADAGYDMNQVKNGVWNNGRVAYKTVTVEMGR